MGKHVYSMELHRPRLCRALPMTEFVAVVRRPPVVTFENFVDAHLVLLRAA